MGVYVAALSRLLVAGIALVVVLAGCGSGGDKIEPEAKSSGSPILNGNKGMQAAAPPANRTNP